MDEYTGQVANLTGYRRLREVAGEWARELVVESGVDPDVALERGYHATESVERLERMGFTRSQYCVSALVVPMRSPDGATVAYQIKARNPRPGRPKYESPTGGKVVIDMHPRMQDAVLDPRTDLFITEGMKKADALTSRGLCTVGLIGVWNWAVRKTKCEVALPDWDYVPLDGRNVTVIYDADARTNADVQEALRRLVRMLEGRGARVLVAYLPPVNGDGKAGVDDYLVAGGSIEDLLAMAAPFVPADVASERMARDVVLRERIGSLWAEWWAREWPGMGGETERSVMKALVLEAQRSGKVVDGGVKVRMAQRTLAERAGVSLGTVTKRVKALEGEGLIKRDNRGRKRDKAGYFILVTEGVTSPIHDGDETTKTSPPSLLTVSGLSRFRWSYVSREWTPDGYEYQYVERMGKVGEHVLETLAMLGGEASVGDLIRAMHRTDRPSRFRDRQLAKLEGRNVVEMDGNTVRLTQGWRDMVEIWREIGGEKEADRLQEQAYRRQREAYRRRHEVRAGPEPVMRPVDDMRQPWPRHPSGCACRECVSRFGERVGSHVDDCRCGRCARLVREKAEGYVEDLEPVALVMVESKPDDWRDHALDCECVECASSFPAYAKPYRWETPKRRRIAA
jgi:hypothetical protein